MLALFMAIASGCLVASIFARRAWAAGARSRSLFTLGAALALTEVVSLAVAPALAERMTTRIGNVPAPEFSATRLDGTIVESAQLKGRVTVLYFWATWCPPCRKEFPKLEDLYERYEPNPRVAFVAINAGLNGDTVETARAYVINGGYRVPMAFDDKHAAARFRIEVIPFLAILDKSWHVRLVHAGYEGSERYVRNLSREIDKLLAE